MNLYPVKKGHQLYKELLFAEHCGIYDWYIMSRGECPLVYLSIPVGHPYYNKDYSDIPVFVHGGLTFKGEIFDKQCIGWDYGHNGDRFDSPIFGTILLKGKEWTFEEIRDEVYSAMNQLTKLLV